MNIETEKFRLASYWDDNIGQLNATVSVSSDYIIFVVFVQQCNSAQHKTSAVGFNKAHHVPHCRVLPPGEFNGINPELLLVCSASRMTTAATGSDYK